MRKTVREFSNEQIAKTVLRIVDEHSGGMKFMELITEFVELCCSKHIAIPEPEKLLHICKRHPQLKVLEYSMKMGHMSRSKWFVYRPKCKHCGY